MGAWGTAISSNDTYADIYGKFFDLYNDGLDVSEISKNLIADNQETINDKDNCNNFWFALAKAQWECKQLDKDIFDQVKKVIETGEDLGVWRQLDADEKDIKKRKVVLDKFLTDLQTERPKAKSRKNKIICQPVFEKGDCLTFKLENGNYGGAVVLEAIKDSEYGHNLIATTRIDQPSKPTKKDFENAEVLVMNYASCDNEPNVKWYLPIRHKQIAHLIERVENIEVHINYDIKNSMLGFVGDFDIWVIQVVDQQLKSEETKPRSKTNQTIKALTKKSKWKLW
ncbi:hypothetical protein [Pedobacter sp. CFBP9032]|uniref:hypothetical protein n=1 Tax=Pedobacter sp. CFBP9032 TaxID=3096539 RepID=UPI002A6AAFF7|nr:hypothetical protein [Pedobacter sp. CFBP9032]MDY0904757.1 hypothetical protein [Pedobacter sp. CFBP9032]